MRRVINARKTELALRRDQLFRFRRVFGARRSGQRDACNEKSKNERTHRKPPPCWFSANYGIISSI
jgi:hypothetical protein